MKRSFAVIVCLCGLAWVGCDNRHDDSAARQAGRDAYRASKEIKKGAKEAAHDLRSAGRQFREGWEQEKHQSHTDRRDRPRDTYGH